MADPDVLAKPLEVPVPAAPGAVIQVGPLMPSLEKALADEFRAVRLPDAPNDPGFASASARARVVVTSGRSGVPADLLARLPRLEAIVHFGVGYDTTDVVGATARGIRVSNTPDVLTDCVADTALGLLLGVFRRFGDAERFLRAGDWAGGGYPLTRRFSGSAVGILGLGRIGRAIATRVEAFGATVAYHNRRPVPDAPYPYAESPVELARRSDALVVAASGGPGSAGLVGRPVLDALGPRGFLVNIARGSVVDEDALVEALVAGRLGGAGLDVFAHEPHVPEALRGRDDVMLLPHVASGTVETRDDMRDLVLENVRSFLAATGLVTPVAETVRAGAGQDA